eukprot:5442951-Amphidinium_carterae.1
MGETDLQSHGHDRIDTQTKLYQMACAIAVRRLESSYCLHFQLTAAFVWKHFRTYKVAVVSAGLCDQDLKFVSISGESVIARLEASHTKVEGEITLHSKSSPQIFHEV